MATKAELEEKLAQLEAELKKSQDKCTQLETKGKSPVYVTRERKIDKFRGTDKENVVDWTDHILSYVKGRFQTNIEKVEFILEHLEGDAKAEVKFRVTSSKASPEEVVQVLRAVFENKDSITQLQQKFFSRNQENGESVREYSYVLMDLLGEINNKVPHMYGDRDTVLKQRFADGVENHNLRRELRRLNSERTELKFWELRDKAMQWLEEESEGKNFSRVNETAVCEATTIGWKELYQKQQEQLETLTKMMATLKEDMKKSSVRTNQPSQYHFSSGSSRNSQRHFQRRDQQSSDSHTDQRGIIICHFCKGPNHIAKNCLLKKRQTNMNRSSKMDQSQETKNQENL
jgi:hypothetical protein